jgi:hypothetical protein
MTSFEEYWLARGGCVSAAEEFGTCGCAATKAPDACCAPAGAAERQRSNITATTAKRETKRSIELFAQCICDRAFKRLHARNTPH